MTTRFYVIGDRATGVLLLTLDPLKAVIMPNEEIEAYAQRTGESYDVVFGKVAEAAKSLILTSDGADVPSSNSLVSEAFGHMAATGTTVSDAEFCFIAEVEAGNWTSMRDGFVPLGPAMRGLRQDVTRAVATPNVGLGGATPDPTDPT